MGGPMNHLVHAMIIAIILYFIMRMVLMQSETMAMNRSLLLGALSLIYMILFGHGWPTHMRSI